MMAVAETTLTVARGTRQPRLDVLPPPARGRAGVGVLPRHVSIISPVSSRASALHLD